MTAMIVSIRGNKLYVLADTSEDLKQLMDELAKYGITKVESYTSLCG